MDPREAAPCQPDPDAVEFVRFCYRRRKVGWPELYDEMCAVANRGSFRGLGVDDLGAIGIRLSLFEMASLAALAASVVAEEQALRRGVGARLGVTDRTSAETVDTARPDGPRRFAAAPAGA
jgi:hypothetical protein